MNKRSLRAALSLIVLALTVILFIRFFQQHPDYIRQLRTVSWWWIAAVIALNIPMVGLLVFIYDACLRLCGKRIAWKEHFLLTAYSTIANFFGPLQSGPGVRALYLKTRHKVRLRDYTLATVLYYGLFAFFSALFLLVGARPWWQTLLAMLVVGSFFGLGLHWLKRRDGAAEASQFRLRGNVVAVLTVLAFFQVLLAAITYFVELKAVNPQISWGQAMSYSGAANFALFVSLTPDAIGFRETFLLFSQRLHHVSTANILSANIIDRGAYLIFLVLLFLLVMSVHAKDKLSIKALKQAAAKASQ